MGENTGSSSSFKTYHNTWLSVSELGEMTTSVLLKPGEREQFEVEDKGNGLSALRTFNGRYVSVTDGEGVRVVTVPTFVGKNELFQIEEAAVAPPSGDC